MLLEQRVPLPDVLLAACEVSKYYDSERGRILVLDRVSLDLHAGEFVALLGPSGSGKSTLLRILAGLVAPSAGTVLARGAPLRGVNAQVAMVFQNFALYPWLTVLENVELGLLATGLSPKERRTRALQAIALIGLEGFAGAYPRELSGGMKQRVGFARALVVEPEVRLLDEPFSALDVLVAENLRHELSGSRAAAAHPHPRHSDGHPQPRRGGESGRPVAYLQREPRAHSRRAARSAAGPAAPPEPGPSPAS